MKRISYHWFIDPIYTLIITSLGINIFIFFLSLVDSDSGDHFFTPFLVVNLFLTPIVTIFYGLGPILLLRTVPDTLYIWNKKTLCFKNKEAIPIQNIESVHVHLIGWGKSRLTYYEIVFKVIPERMKNKRRKTIIAVPAYDIRNIFQMEEKFLGNLKDIGLEEKKIQWEKRTPKNAFLVRDKFKK